MKTMCKLFFVNCDLRTPMRILTSVITTAPAKMAAGNLVPRESEIALSSPAKQEWEVESSWSLRIGNPLMGEDVAAAVVVENGTMGLD